MVLKLSLKESPKQLNLREESSQNQENHHCCRHCRRRHCRDEIRGCSPAPVGAMGRGDKGHDPEDPDVARHLRDGRGGCPCLRRGGLPPRGANTRTNFLLADCPPPDSALTSRIHALLRLHQLKKEHTQPNPPPPPPPVSTITTATTTVSFASTATENENVPTQLSDEEVYRPCFLGEFDQPGSANQSPSDHSCSFVPTDSGFHRLPPAFDGFELDEICASDRSTNTSTEMLEFERMKVERQISASLYAMNGVQEYYDILHNTYCGGGDEDAALWISHLFAIYRRT
uniref:Uncharacterized protein n=1 Tax=Ananas comosus var. bracteatus TaxID=296719 RepID=A0A6V7QC29_ANACO|nr:unnamed protein product [Ananas comosus var. bracteatus]